MNSATSPIADKGSVLGENTDLDPDLAKKLWEEGAFFVLTGMPARTQFGIDLISWHVGEKFLGLKMIPPGLHYISYRLVYWWLQ